MTTAATRGCRGPPTWREFICAAAVSLWILAPEKAVVEAACGNARLIGEVCCFAGTYLPTGFIPLDGSPQPINNNPALFNLLLTTYGGDGSTYFNVPNMQGRTIAHVGGSYTFGQTLGSETVTLTASNLPAHTHSVTLDSPLPPTYPKGQSPANSDTTLPVGQQAVVIPYDDNGGASASGQVFQTTASVSGSSPPAAHENRQPYLVVRCGVAAQGTFPVQSS